MAMNTLKVQAHVPEEGHTLKPSYLEAVSRVERLHRRLLDLIKDEFDRMGWDDIGPVQAIMMFNIGDSELTAGELRSRGYYLGSNVSYNLKKLVDAPQWKAMLTHHPRREASEYEEFLTSRYPKGDWQRLYVCFDHSLFGFHFTK